MGRDGRARGFASVPRTERGLPRRACRGRGLRSLSLWTTAQNAEVVVGMSRMSRQTHKAPSAGRQGIYMCVCAPSSSWGGCLDQGEHLAGYVSIAGGYGYEHAHEANAHVATTWPVCEWQDCAASTMLTPGGTCSCALSPTSLPPALIMAVGCPVEQRTASLEVARTMPGEIPVRAHTRAQTYTWYTMVPI